ncbi:MAG: hypothetical protein AAF995_05405 [Planctomycetota bacterium]
MIRSLAPLMLVSVLLAGCSPAPSSTSVAIAPRAYPDAFDGAREVLRSYGFRLAYVDARAGVLESEPKSTAGFATPGDSEQSGLLQEWEDLTNEHERVVRIRFVPAAPGADGGLDEALPDRTAPGAGAGAPTRAEVEVMVYRLRRPGWRLETESPTRSTRAVDPALAARGMGPRHATPLGPDTRLAARIARDLERRLSDDAAE